MDIALHDMSTLLLSIGFIALLLVIPFSIGYCMKHHHANYPLLGEDNHVLLSPVDDGDFSAQRRYQFGGRRSPDGLTETELPGLHRTPRHPHRCNGVDVVLSPQSSVTTLDL
jgi:hypothetical protein